MSPQDPREAAVLAAIDPATQLADLLALCSIPSITGSEAAARDEVARFLRAAGLDVRTWDADPVALASDPAWPGSEMPRATLPLVTGSLAGGAAGRGGLVDADAAAGAAGGSGLADAAGAAGRGRLADAGWAPDAGGRAPEPGIDPRLPAPDSARRPRKRLLLVAHTDVVPAGDPATWATPPFEPVVRDGHLFGRGACDMKGGLVAALAAVRAVATTLRSDGIEGEVLFVGVPSEEDGGGGTLAAIRAGCTGDMAVIPEPTGLAVVTVHAGAITFRLEVPGRAAHASTRREGISALEKLEVIHAALRADEAARNASETRPEMVALGLPYPTIIGRVSGGAWASSLPDLVIADGRYGVRVGQTTAEAADELRGVVAAACAADPWLRDHPVGVSIWGGMFGSGEVPADHRLPVGIAAAAADVFGTAPAVVGVPYGADMALLIREGRTPTVLFGPGDVRVAHAADEHVALSEVDACARVLATWLVRELAAPAP